MTNTIVRYHGALPAPKVREGWVTWRRPHGMLYSAPQITVPAGSDRCELLEEVSGLEMEFGECVADLLQIQITRYLSQSLTSKLDCRTGMRRLLQHLQGPQPIDYLLVPDVSALPDDPLLLLQLGAVLWEQDIQLVITSDIWPDVYQELQTAIHGLLEK